MDQSPGTQSKRADSKDTPPTKKVASGTGAVASKKISYAKAAARVASQPSPFSIIIHGPAGGSDPLPKDAFYSLVRFLTEQWIEQGSRATSRASKWSNGTGYIHATDKSSQDWYMKTLNSAPVKEFMAFRKQEYNMTTVKVKVPVTLSFMKPEKLLGAAFKRAEVQGRYGVKAVHQIKDESCIIRLLAEDSLVKAINRLGNTLHLGCDVLRFETTSDQKDDQPQVGEGKAEGQSNDPQQ